MYEGKGVRYIHEYGKVNLRLKEVMDERGINRNQLARKIDVRFEVSDKWYRGDLANMDLDILARICFVLGCQPGDLLVYEEKTTETAGN